MKHRGTIKWISAGGDHSSDYWGEYSGMGLSLGRKTGFGSYGPKYLQKGARVFVLRVNPDNMDMDIETYISQADGTRDY